MHEAYLRLVLQNRVTWNDHTHFFAVAATMIRRVLFDHSKSERCLKRGGGVSPRDLDSQLAARSQPSLDRVAIAEALAKLGRVSPRLSRVVEMRFFDGLSEGEIAREVGVSERTVRQDWRAARAWLRRELSGGEAA